MNCNFNCIPPNRFIFAGSFKNGMEQLTRYLKGAEAGPSSTASDAENSTGTLPTRKRPMLDRPLSSDEELGQSKFSFLRCFEPLINTWKGDFLIPPSFPKTIPSPTTLTQEKVPDLASAPAPVCASAPAYAPALARASTFMSPLPSDPPKVIP